MGSAVTKGLISLHISTYNISTSLHIEAFLKKIDRVGVSGLRWIDYGSAEVQFSTRENPSPPSLP